MNKFFFQKNTDNNKIINKNLVKNYFTRFFGFEKDLDLTDDVAVLRRRNKVIKNIIFLYNITIFIMMTIFTLSMQFIILKNSNAGYRGHQILNWIIMIATFPTTFLINFLLKKIINKDNPDDNYKLRLSRQNICMYISIIYLFIAPLLFYIKINYHLSNDNEIINYQNIFETFSYIMFYIALLICAFYNDKRLILYAAMIMFAMLSILHFFVTHNFVELAKNFNEKKLGAYISDITLRTLLFIIFSSILYSITNVTYHIQKERRKELLKRKNVEQDFKMLSSTIMDYIKMSPAQFFNYKEIENTLKISLHLSTLVGLRAEEKEKLNDFSKIHLRANEILEQEEVDKKDYIKENYSKHERHEELREKTILGTMIIRRIQITQKAETILRMYVENNIENELMKNDSFYTDLTENIILLSEIYYRLRSPQNYKPPYRHIDSVEIIKSKLNLLFDENLLNAFTSFEHDFNEIYLNL